MQKKTVSIQKLLYAGESENMRERVPGHKWWQDLERELLSGEKLCFSAALIASESGWQRAEAAMIHHHKPSCNLEYAVSFPYDQTTISTSGKNAKLDGKFTVYRTP